MNYYYVNKHPEDNGDYEVHRYGCQWLHDAPNRSFLGSFRSCRPAIREAKKDYPQVNGCAYCCRDCHTT